MLVTARYGKRTLLLGITEASGVGGASYQRERIETEGGESDKANIKPNIKGS